MGAYVFFGCRILRRSIRPRLDSTNIRFGCARLPACALSIPGEQNIAYRGGYIMLIWIKLSPFSWVQLLPEGRSGCQLNLQRELGNYWLWRFLALSGQARGLPAPHAYALPVVPQ